MPVNAGTAYVKIEPDFSSFHAQVREQVKPVTQDVRMQVDQTSMRGATRAVNEHVTSLHSALGGVLSQSKVYQGLRSTITGTTAALIGGGGLVEGLVAAVKAGSAEETAMARLGKAVSNAGISWKGHGEEIETWIKTTARAKGFMDTDLSNAFANMIRTTGNVAEAQTLLNDAMDISRTKGTDLAGAQSLLARVYNGSYMGLKRLGIAITPVTTAQEALKTSTANLNAAQKHQIDLIRESNMSSDEKKKAIDKIKESTSTATDVEKAHAKALDSTATRTEALGLIQQKFGGQAAVYANTTAGHYARLKVSFDQILETIGKSLLPELDKLSVKGVKLAADFQKHWPEIQQDIKDVVQPLKDVASAVFGFIKANPEIAKTAISFGLIAAAAVKLRESVLGRSIGVLLNFAGGLGRVRVPGIGGGAAAGATTATMRVGVMEVGEMVVGKGVGGAGGLGGVGGAGGVGGLGGLSGGAVSTAEKDVETSLRSRVAGAVKGALGRAGTGLAIAGFGTILSQTVGSAIGGGTGKAFKNIGSGVATGAGIGMLFGPEGALAGGVVGALVGGVKTFVHDHEKTVSKQFADALTRGMPDAVAGSINQAARKVRDQYVKAQPPHVGGPTGPIVLPGTVPGLPRMPPTPGLNEPTSDPKENARQWNEAWNQRFKAAYTYGKQTAQLYQQGYDAVRYKTPQTFVAWMHDMEARLKNAPKTAQQSGARSMLLYAQSLISGGKLPKNAMGGVIRDVERQYPGLDTYLKVHSLDTAKAVAHNYNFAQARKNTHATITDIKNQWGLGKLGVTGEAKDTTRDVLKEADFLHTQMRSKTKATRIAATDEWRQLKKDSIQLAVDAKNGMLLNAIQNRDGNDKAYKNLRDRVQGHLKQIPEDAKASTSKTRDQLVGQTGKNILASVGIFGNFASNVQSAVKSGALNTQQAADKIGSAVNRQLQAFGQKPIPGLVSKAGQAAWQNWWKGMQGMTVGSGGTPSASNLQAAGFAAGGLLQIGRPGAKGRDAIPMNLGGAGVVVGDGEQVMVLNAQQQAAMNSRWRDVGGLAGFFQRFNLPHYMAKGGIIPKYAGGGVVSEVNSLASAAGFNKMAIAGILGNAWQESGGNPNTPGGGMWQQISNFGSGTGGSLVQQWARMLPQILGLRAALNAASTPGAAAAIFEQGFEKAGIPAMANRIMYANEAYAGQLGAGLTGGSAHLPGIKIPGSGTMHTLVQQSADKMITAANAYLDAHQPVATVGGGGVSTAGVTGAAGLGSFDGLRVANWIIPILNWAQGHGWAGSITSGFRPGAVTNTGQPSNHSLTSYPGGAVDVGDQHASAQGLALWDVVKNYPGSPKLYSAAYGPGAWGPYKDSPHDYGHFSATGHALGGLVRMFNGGGVAHHDKKKHGPHHKPWWQSALTALKKGAVVKGPTLDKLTANLRNLGLNGWNKPLTHLGGAVARDQTLQQVAAGVIDTDRITTLLTSNPTLWPDPTKPITGDAIHTILHQLGYAVQGKDALEWLSQELVDQLALRRSLMNLAHHVKTQYDERHKILTQAIKRQKQLQDEIAGLNNQLHPKGKHAKAPTGAHKKALTDKLNKARKQLVGVTSVISVTQNQIGNLNTAWGVDLGGGSLPSMYEMYGPLSSGGTGTQGVLGQLYQAQGPVVNPFRTGFSAQGLINALPGSLTNWYGDIGGTLGTINTFGKDFFTAPADTSTTDGSAAATDPYALELQRLASQRDLLDALQMPSIVSYPYGGSFADGGTVPGPPGQPVLITAHGGELVTPRDDVSGGHTFEIHGDPRTVALLEQMIERVNVSSNRGQSRTADRRMRLPGNQAR